MTVIDIHSEKIIPIGSVPRHLPNRPHISTIYRWTTAGLETLKIGGRVFTSVEALERFTEHRGGRPKLPKSEPTLQHRREIEEAERKLRDAGM